MSGASSIFKFFFHASPMFTHRLKSLHPIGHSIIVNIIFFAQLFLPTFMFMYNSTSIPSVQKQAKASSDSELGLELRCYSQSNQKLVVTKQLKTLFKYCVRVETLPIGCEIDKAYSKTKKQTSQSKTIKIKQIRRINKGRKQRFKILLYLTRILAYIQYQSN